MSGSVSACVSKCMGLSKRENDVREKKGKSVSAESLRSASE